MIQALYQMPGPWARAARPCVAPLLAPPHIVAMNEDPHRAAEPGTEIVPYDPEAYAEDRGRVETGFWAKVRKTLGQVPFVEEAVAGDSPAARSAGWPAATFASRRAM